MAGSGVGDRASETLLERKEELAREIAGALYQERPDLLERHGERGRRKCLQDMRYNIEHLAPAVALGEPLLFERYVVWLRDMLAARGVQVDEVRRSLELTVEAANGVMDGEEAAAVQVVLETGLRALDERPQG